VRSSKKYYAHDEKGEYGVGDIVWIEEHRPISKLKRWTVVRGEKSKKTEAVDLGDSVDTGKKARKVKPKMQ